MSNKKQNALIFLCWAVYTTAYLGRYSYNSNINLVMSDYSVSHADAGLVTTFFFLAYGIGQFANGFLCKKYPKRVLFPIVLSLSAVLNIIMFMRVPFVAVKYLWLINGLLQSSLWASIIDIIGQRLDDNHMERAVMVLSTTTPVGTLLTYSLSSCLVHFGIYKYAYLIGAVAMATVGVIWFAVYNKFDKMQNTIKEFVPKQRNTGKPNRTVLILVSMLCGFAIVDNFVKDGLNTWVPSMLKEGYSLSDDLSILLTLLLPILGIFGATFAVTLNRKIRSLTTLSAVFFASASIFTVLIMLEMKKSMIITLLSFGAVVLLMHAVNNVVTSMTPLYLREKADSGKLAGILNGCCYVGSTVSSYLFGAVADKKGWSAVIVILIVCLVASAFIGAAYSLVKRIKK